MNKQYEFADFEQIGNNLIIRLMGDLDQHIEGSIRRTADIILDRGLTKNLIFDFAGVGFMDSSGIGVVMGRYKRIRSFGGNLIVTGAGENIIRIMKMSGMLDILQVYEKTEDALKALEHGI